MMSLLYELVMMLLPTITHEEGANLPPELKPSRWTCPVEGMDPTVMEFNVVQERNEYAMRVIKRFMLIYLIIRTSCIALAYLLELLKDYLWYLFGPQKNYHGIGRSFNIVRRCYDLLKKFLMYNWSLRWISKLLLLTEFLYYANHDITMPLIIIITRMCLVLVDWYQIWQRCFDSMIGQIKFHFKMRNETLRSACPICFTCVPNTVMVPCGHSFCSNCVISHLNYSYNQVVPYKCPICRSDITNAQQFYLS